MASDFQLTPENIEMMKDVLIEHVPHARALGLTIQDAKRGECWLTIPYDKKLVGNAETGVIHGGVITAMLDNACGVAVWRCSLRCPNAYRLRRSICASTI